MKFRIRTSGSLFERSNEPVGAVNCGKVCAARSNLVCFNGPGERARAGKKSGMDRIHLSSL